MIGWIVIGIFFALLAFAVVRETLKPTDPGRYAPFRYRRSFRR
jgi:hypothetical protein